MIACTAWHLLDGVMISLCCPCAASCLPALFLFLPTCSIVGQVGGLLLPYSGLSVLDCVGLSFVHVIDRLQFFVIFLIGEKNVMVIVVLGRLILILTIFLLLCWIKQITELCESSIGG